MSFDQAASSRVAAIVAAALFAALVLFQLALAVGARWGRAAYGGRSAELPARLRITSAVAAVVWTGVALVVLRRAGAVGWSPVPATWAPLVTWAVVGVLVVAVVLNAITPSAIERAIWLPVSVLLLVATATVALVSPH